MTSNLFYQLALVEHWQAPTLSSGTRNTDAVSRRSVYQRHRLVPMITKIEEVLEFINIVADQGFWTRANAQNRRTALSSLAEILVEDDQTVEYMDDNMDTIRTRFMNLNPKMRGESVETYVSRARSTLSEFKHWREDRPGWERNVSARPARAADTDKPKRAAKAEEIKVPPAAQPSDDGRDVGFPLSSGFEFRANLPRAGLTVEDLRRIGMFLAAYTKDWTPPASQSGSSFGALTDNSPH
jgi:hypothetical protein